MAEHKEIGIYMHVPFCKSKCYYCDFNSFCGKEALIPSYFDAIVKEIGLYSEVLEGYKVKSIFIGGGTPSYVEPHFIDEVLNALKKQVYINFDAEISMESNPGTLSYDKLKFYKTMGINRISIGLQAWQDHLLRSIGRIHDVQGFVDSYHRIREAGFQNVNVDLIFGLPGQTGEDWEETLSKVIDINPEHISCYSLKLEEDTALWHKVEQGEVEMLDDTLDRMMYHETIRQLGKAGYQHYEISNFAKEGYACRHNLMYWKCGEYIGLGTGAHSYFQSKRFHNTNTLQEYIASIKEKGQIPSEEVEPILNDEKMQEYMLLGLRLIEGVSIQHFNEVFNTDLFEVFGANIERLFQKGLLEKDGDQIKLSEQGLDYANQVFIEFI